MSAATTIPKPLLPILVPVASGGMLIAAATNMESLYEFGEKIYGSGLAWTLPTAVIGYEIVSSIVYFLTPKSLPSIRKSALVGALLGFAATVVLAILWAFIADGVLPDGLWMKIVMKPVPSLIAAAFLHMLILVWHANTAAKAAAKEADAAPISKPAAEPVASAPAPLPPRPIVPPAAVPPTPGSNPAPLPPKPAPAAPPAPPAAEQPALPKPVPAPRPAAPKPAPAPAAEPELPRVAREHVERAASLLLEIVAADGDTLALESGQALKHFSGCSDRTVRAALHVARVELGLPLPRSRRHRKLVAA